MYFERGFVSWGEEGLGVVIFVIGFAFSICVLTIFRFVDQALTVAVRSSLVVFTSARLYVMLTVFPSNEEESRVQPCTVKLAFRGAIYTCSV